MEINVAIQVAAIFRQGKIIPRWFIWENRKYFVTTVNYIWDDSEGRETVHYFAVTDNVNNYELAFHSRQLTWTIEKLYST